MNQLTVATLAAISIAMVFVSCLISPSDGSCLQDEIRIRHFVYQQESGENDTQYFCDYTNTACNQSADMPVVWCINRQFINGDHNDWRRYYDIIDMNYTLIENTTASLTLKWNTSALTSRQREGEGPPLTLYCARCSCSESSLPLLVCANNQHSYFFVVAGEQAAESCDTLLPGESTTSTVDPPTSSSASGASETTTVSPSLTIASTSVPPAAAARASALPSSTPTITSGGPNTEQSSSPDLPFQVSLGVLLPVLVVGTCVLVPVLFLIGYYCGRQRSRREKWRSDPARGTLDRKVVLVANNPIAQEAELTD